ncbi:MAG: hypothetical protein IJ930_03915 [Lachnospiraceae bacterium]|nr:hypothetical protein [Lachnospiraceae bacterium]
MQAEQMYADFFKNADEMIKANGAAEAARSEALGQIIANGADKLDAAAEKAGTERKAMEENLSRAIKGTAEDILKKVSESDAYSHQDAVRVYKNVQASMIEELGKQTLELKAEIEELRAELSMAVKKTAELENEKLGRRLGIPVRILIVLSAAMIILEILNMAGVFTIFSDYLHLISAGL